LHEPKRVFPQPVKPRPTLVWLAAAGWHVGEGGEAVRARTSALQPVRRPAVQPGWMLLLPPG